MNKVYVIYLGKELYAWTRDKRLRDQFLNFRTHKFFTSKHELDIEEYSEFVEKYHDGELVEDIIHIEGNPYKIAMTKYEQGKFTAYINTIVDVYSDAINRLKRFMIDRKIYQLLVDIDPVLQTIEDPHMNEKIACAVIDMKEADIFYDMFPDTF